ncbi:agmatine deiminase family protein [Perlabentimonas gracilis]|uniref:agmatine deiminase family protein n=1 Tax=Perlabentimonas gracilis TaxID=2715279 RepID=UPI001408B661|nr:agmatine deiminase family protein [Perlabentimonas gracilis]NHB67319.1 agmatine deiminase family protein [Perlabentimonas gracilis]
MIIDSQTNFVYFSGLLRSTFPEEYARISSILNEHKVNHGLLKSTKGYWCRDYMPIQIGEGEFVGFRYEPSYHKEPEDIAAQSDPKLVCQSNGIPAKFSNINLDGGNVVRWHNRVMISDRIFDENEEIPQVKLIDQLEKFFKAEVIVIPQVKCDMTGHADGMVRFVGRDTILINELENEYKYWQKGIKRVIIEHNLNYIEVPWSEPKSNKTISALGCYINYLHVGDLIILPKFNDDNLDAKAYNLIQSVFKTSTVKTVEINRIAEEGGVLNCISWGILSQ